MVCSKDARKVIEKYPVLKDRIFLIEQALYKAFSKNFNALYKKKNNLEAVLAMSKNGYFRYIDRKIDQIEWNNIMFHYFSVCNEYLKEDFKYEDLLAFNEICKHDLNHVKSFYKKLKVKNLWYLSKVLKESQKNNIINYKNIDDVSYINKCKGEKINYIGCNIEQFKVN